MASNTQLRAQLPAMLLLHAVLYRKFASDKTSYFHARPNIMAHYVPFLIAFIWMAFYGAYLWFFDPIMNDPSFDRIWGYHSQSELIVVSMLAIQSYDTPISIIVPDLRAFTFVAHHAVVLSLSILCLDRVRSPPRRYRAFYYYAVYFLGVIELSSPWLAVVDAMRDFPAIADRFPALNEVARVVFALMFYAVRVFGWVPVSIEFWRDALSLLQEDAAMHTMPKWVPVFWLTTHAGLTCLQAWWGFLILRAVYAMVTGDEEHRKNEAKSA
mmetsp:Transcript_10623/g.32672  ORF Transcript_10623/g.32672 Transcript_10623/m.32672 type:complete len:269 (-) Transcript_10623:52-858(-)